VPDTPRAPSADVQPEEAKTPLSARVSVMEMWIMGGLVLAQTALTVVALDGIVDRATAATDVPRAEAQQTILISLIPPALLGVLLVLSAWGLGRRHPWARWTGLGASVMLFALALLTMLAAGGLLLVSLLLVVLSMAAATSLVARATPDLIPRLRNRG
jgi:hypothetical protein